MRPFFLVAALAAAQVALCLSSSEARADDTQLDAGAYSTRESLAGAGLLGIGALSLGGGAAGVASDTAFGRGAAVPLFAGGAIEGVLGVASLARAQRVRLEMDGDGTIAPTTADREGARMQTLRLRMAGAEPFAVGGFIAGGLIGYFGRTSDAMRGFGTGLAAESLVLLATSALAESRATRFAAALKRVNLGVATAPSGGMLRIAVALP